MTRLLLFLCLLPFLFLGCAKQTAPTGGPKDTIPPTLIRGSSIPKNGEINYKGNKVVLVFNEAIQINNAREQVMFIPDVDKKFTLKAKKNTAILEFEEPLKDSTTYSINFREAIQDVNEKNVPPNLKIAFSTGTYIDSLKITGKTINPLKNEKLKEITVALYETDTFNIFKHKPIYITRTNKLGQFEIENLKPGTYYIYAFDDKNKNLIVDSKSEAYGFLRDSIHLTNNVDSLTIPLITMDSRDLTFMSGRSYNTYFNLRLNKQIVKYSITTEEPYNLKSSYGDDQSNVKLYNTFPEADSILINFKAMDSVFNQIDTTLYAKIIKRDVKPEKFTISTKSTTYNKDQGNINAIYKFNKPINTINIDSMVLHIDSTRILPINKEEILLDTVLHTLTITKKIDKRIFENKVEEETDTAQVKKELKEENILLFKKASFISVENDSSAEYKETLKPLTAEQTSTLLINVETEETHFIVQVLDKSFKVVATAINEKKITFNYLQPSDYYITLIIDKDQNGEWTYTNPKERKEPEPIIFYQNEKKQFLQPLKANWEVGPLLITY
jgi:uncharacterized protein (DUF2141 family)